MTLTFFSAMSNDLNLPMPAARIRNLSDGTVQITLGDLKGWVTSHHLITPKIHQMQKAWQEANQHLHS